MTLFDHRRKEVLEQLAPLATRMRPHNLDEFVGQKHLLAEDRVLRKAIDADRVPSLILWGPPGSGKTTLARLIAHVTKSHFEQLSAVTSGVRELRALIGVANRSRCQSGAVWHQPAGNKRAIEGRSAFSRSLHHPSPGELRAGIHIRR